MEQSEQSGYELCRLYSLNTKCGSYKISKNNVTGLFDIDDLNEDVHNHLCCLNIRKRHDKSDDWSERLLIENRLGFKLNENDKLCANHRYTLGAGFKQSKRCQHPQQPPEIGKKAPATIPVSISKYIFIAKKYNILFPIGSVLCFNHMKNENKIDEEESSDRHVTENDADYEIPEPVIPPNVLDSSEAGVLDLSETLDVSLVKFQIKKKK